MILFDRNGERDRLTSLIRPRARISLDISALTGIHPSALDTAPPFAEIIPAARRLAAGRPIVGHSVGMDIAMVEAAGLTLRARSMTPFNWRPSFFRTCRTTVSPPWRAPGIPGGSGHRALADAETTVGVFLALLAELDAHDTSTLEEVAAQARAAGWGLAGLFAGAALRRPTGPMFKPDEGSTKLGPHEMAFLTPRERPETLKSTGSSALVSTETIRETLRKGPLPDLVPHYEHRPQQEAMAVAVADALNNDGQLMVEAGTGTGKAWPICSRRPCTQSSAASVWLSRPTRWLCRTSCSTRTSPISSRLLSDWGSQSLMRRCSRGGRTTSACAAGSTRSASRPWTPARRA